MRDTDALASAPVVSLSSPHTRPPASFFALLRALKLHRHLLVQLVGRDVASRYRGSWAGIVWSLLLPCVMLAVYLFVFGRVFVPAKTAVSDNSVSFVLSLFAGMLLHGLLAECLGRAPTAVLAQPSYVKKVVFPIELLPLTVVGTAVVQFLIGSSVLIAGLIATGGAAPTAVFWPFAWLPLVAFAAGISFMLSALTVYLRDLAQVTGFFTTILLFLAPVFYSLDHAPAGWQQWLMLNPLTVPIEASRALLMKGVWPDLSVWAIHALLCLSTLQGGWWIFQRTRRGFADVI